jgi:hypothetical protein
MIGTIEADMGGTNINDVLNAIYAVPKVHEYERKIILLTDGEVYDLQSVFNIVQSDKNVPVFTLGIGNSVSHELVQGLAERTNGFCEIIMDADLIEEKVLQQFRRTMYEKISIEIAANKIQLRPGQEYIHCVIPMTEFSDVHQKNDYININFLDEQGQTEEENIIPLEWIYEEEDDTENTEVNKENKSIHLHEYPLRLTWADEQIRKLSEKLENVTVTEHGLEQNEIKKSIIAISKQYHILTPYTAFAGVLESKSNKRTEKIKTIITPLHPGKYAGKHMEQLIFANSGDSSKKNRAYDSTSNAIDAFQIKRGVGKLKSLKVSSARRLSLCDEEPNNEVDFGYLSYNSPSVNVKCNIIDILFAHGISIFSKAMEFDGSISWLTLSKYAIIPDMPPECPHDIWSTLLFVEFMRFHKMYDCIEYKMMVDKAKAYLLKRDRNIKDEWRANIIRLFIK